MLKKDTMLITMLSIAKVIYRNAFLEASSALPMKNCDK